MQGVVEYRRAVSSPEDMPRKHLAGKARRRIGHRGVRYQPMAAGHLVTRGWAGKPSCRTVRRSLATGGKRSAQPGYGRRREDGSPKGQDPARSWPGLGSRQPLRRSRARQGIIKGAFIQMPTGDRSRSSNRSSTVSSAFISGSGVLVSCSIASPALVLLAGSDKPQRPAHQRYKVCAAHKTQCCG